MEQCVCLDNPSYKKGCHIWYPLMMQPHSFLILIQFLLNPFFQVFGWTIHLRSWYQTPSMQRSFLILLCMIPYFVSPNNCPSFLLDPYKHVTCDQNIHRFQFDMSPDSLYGCYVSYVYFMYDLHENFDELLSQGLDLPWIDLHDFDYEDLWTTSGWCFGWTGLTAPKRRQSNLSFIMSLSWLFARLESNQLRWQLWYGCLLDLKLSWWWKRTTMSWTKLGLLVILLHNHDGWC